MNAKKSTEKSRTNGNGDTIVGRITIEVDFNGTTGKVEHDLVVSTFEAQGRFGGTTTTEFIGADTGATTKNGEPYYQTRIGALIAPLFRKARK